MSSTPQTDLLPLTPDEVLTTTRAVRRRLDLTRPVPLEVVREALTIALQAPSGSNRQQWQWIVLTDPGVKAQIAEQYRRVHDTYLQSQTHPTGSSGERIVSSSTYLSDVLDQVPVLVIAALDTGSADLPAGNQAGLWGSLLPAAWTFALALRARGLGSAWTSMHLLREREIADVLGLPATVHQGVLLPVAYTLGVDFRPAKRADLDSVLHLNRW